MSRFFFYPDNTNYVLFTDQALLHMYAHAQRRPWQKEAGGEIFSLEPNASGLVIHTARGPNPGDYRRRCAWNPDTRASDRDRQIEYTQNRHAVGLWHTHPETLPSPSGRDHVTTCEYLDSFGGDRSRYLMVIIGNQGRIPGMAVWVASYKSVNKWAQLNEISSSEAGRVSRK
jgi:proteasome lid subunit RPN8/RPN11